MDNIPFQNIGSAVVYDLEQQQTLDSLIVNAKEHEKSTKRSTHYFQLIDDLSLPNIVSHLSLSSCNSFLYLGGSYPPQVKIYDLENYSEKVSQHTQQHILDIEPLPIDPPVNKFVVLYDSRVVEFYHQFAKHQNIRVPFLARKILYSPPHCDLYIAGACDRVFRFNLELGQMLPSVELTQDNSEEEEVNVFCASRNRLHQLLAFGCEDGSVKFVDPRKKTLCSTFSAIPHIKERMKSGFGNHATSESNNRHHQYLTSIQEEPISAEEVEYDFDGVTFAVGSDQGQIGLFDLRKDGILYLKTHHHDSEITSIKFTDTKNKYIVSSDRYTIKVWRREKPPFENVTNIQPRGKINDVLVYPDSGMIFVGQDREKVTPYYIPALGPSPYWCSFLDHFLGSLITTGTSSSDRTSSSTGGKKSVMYKDMDTKFVSVKEVKRLGMEGLVGTKLLVSDLHGWRMDKKLYERLAGLRDEGMRSREIQRIIINEKFEQEMEENRMTDNNNNNRNDNRRRRRRKEEKHQDQRNRKRKRVHGFQDDEEDERKRERGKIRKM